MLTSAEELSGALESDGTVMVPVSRELGPHGRALLLLAVARAVDVLAADHELSVGLFLEHELREEDRAGTVAGLVVSRGVGGENE